MSIAVNEILADMSPGWRRTIYGAITAAGVVASYFTFVDGRIAHAETNIKHNSERITGVEADIKDIKGSVIDLREKQAVNGQRLQDVKESVDAINQKIDRLIMQGQRRAQYP